MIVLLAIVVSADIQSLLEFVEHFLQAPLAFRVSIEKPGVILLGLPLYVTCSFSLAILASI